VTAKSRVIHTTFECGIHGRWLNEINSTFQRKTKPCWWSIQYYYYFYNYYYHYYYLQRSELSFLSRLRSFGTSTTTTKLSRPSRSVGEKKKKKFPSKFSEPEPAPKTWYRAAEAAGTPNQRAKQNIMASTSSGSLADQPLEPDVSTFFFFPHA
jgi:hypothetical protein